ncbi:MAG: Arginine-tRNA ligase [Parcubacteria group bacterium GW2011_GWA2_47_16]|nr:MAG: Arginine-tRNA ligase [Parcubacteria group bacterium GW2011_GWA2_47_16]
MIAEKIKKIILESLQKLDVEAKEVSLEHPDEISNGDYSTNVALAYAKTMKMKPRELAEKIFVELEKNKPKEIERIEIAGPGFINFYLSREFITENISAILRHAQDFGKNKILAGRKVMVEYTDPNPFKEFHIGHLMSNAVGESVSRLVEFQGAEVKRACWQGDVGLHVAKAVWGMQKKIQDSRFKIQEAGTKEWGQAYAIGSFAYEGQTKYHMQTWYGKQSGDFLDILTGDVVRNAKTEINDLNKEIFDKSDKEVNTLYDAGRKVSLAHFEEIYKKLDTKFDYNFFEGIEGRDGKPIVEEYLKYGVFEKSEGAIVYRGDKHGLHTRVFINSQGLPTYEAKELGLNKKKFELEPHLEKSIIVTANEQSEYFKVVLRAMGEIFPEIAKRTKHLAHGMLRLSTGKMSSRTGNVITGESLMTAVEAMVHKKLEERELETVEKNKIAEAVAIGAIKYSILKQAIGSDIIYDFEKSISFEGDSGPYLQYSYVRAKSVLQKAKDVGIEPVNLRKAKPSEISLLERLLVRFPEVVLRAGSEYAPHLVATYLTELAGSFNSYYAKNQIVNVEDSTSAYKAALTESFAATVKNGLWLLGINVPERM